MTDYAVYFDQIKAPWIHCDDTTIWDILDDLENEQLDAVFMDVLQNALACCEDSGEPLQGFAGKMTWREAREKFIYDEIEWMLDMTIRDSQLAEGFTHWGIHLEVIE